MEVNKSRPILVTGSHRSGSTWVGQMISRSPAVEYIHEPFNINPRSGICGGQFKNWFTYICDDNALLHYDYLKHCFSFRYPLAYKIREINSLKDAGRFLRDYGRFTVKRIRRKRPLVKDPIAIFSAAWLARTFNMDVIVLIRHPAAFAGSIKQANWPHPFRHFLNQPLLMRDLLSGFASEIETFTVDEKDIIDQAILLWNIVHSTIIKYKSSHAKWHFIRHEDIASNPIVEFGNLFQQVNLDYPPPVQHEISRFSRSISSHGPEETLSIKRDSQSAIWNWRHRLTAAEIDRVRAGTQRFSHFFYDHNDW